MKMQVAREIKYMRRVDPIFNQLEKIKLYNNSINVYKRLIYRFENVSSEINIERKMH